MSLADYYELLQISPNAEPETVHRVFRMLAMRFHPDNPETGDNQRFLTLNRAYEVLSDPDQRREYDELFLQQKEEPMAVFWLKDFTEGTEGEANRRMGILCLLYHKRRVNPEEPGMSLLQLETVMAFPREHLRFSLWFLQEKKFVRFNENSEYEITGEGTEYTESNSPKQEHLQRLLNAPKNVTPEPARPVGQPAAAGPQEFSTPITQPRPNSRPRTVITVSLPDSRRQPLASRPS